MNITAEIVPGSWTRALNLCRNTVWKDGVPREPTDEFKHALCLSEHGPLSLVEYYIHIEGIKYWTAAHFTRHKFGVTWGQSTLRDDRHSIACSRDELPQGEMVNLDCQINALELIYMARRRLCGMAHAETRAVMRAILDAVEKVDPIITRYCVPNCVYRGFCPEGTHGCGLADSPRFFDITNEYDNLH